MAVRKQLRDRVVNRQGKPLTRLERSTGTDSLKLAKELYPKLMSQLRQELAERAGSALLETKEDAALRVFAGIYDNLAAPGACSAQRFLRSDPKSFGIIGKSPFARAVRCKG